MTRIDRYILLLFLRTVLVCFCSLAGIFIVFHAFTSMDELVQQGRRGGGLLAVAAGYYGPYMLLLFDWTGAIIALMALLFTVGWLRRTGELTATLAAGISHGRILKPMVLATAAIILVQLFNRECLIPRYRDALAMEAENIGGQTEHAILPRDDLTSGILIEGEVLRTPSDVIVEPSFRLYGDYPGYGDLLLARTATWKPAENDRPSGYLLQDVRRPEHIDQLPSAAGEERAILMTSHDQPWLESGECFVATSVHPNLLQQSQSATRMASVAELAGRVRNPAVHSSASVRVLLHERIIRPALDLALVLLGLPLVVNRRQRNLFMMIGAAIGLVLLFFGIKTLAGAMGSNGYLVSPSVAAWIPLWVIGPWAYVRWCGVQTL